MRIIGSVRAALTWFRVVAAAAIALLIGVVAYGRRRQRLGDALGRVKEDRKRLREVAEKGSDQAVEDIWRESRR